MPAKRSDRTESTSAGPPEIDIPERQLDNLIRTRLVYLNVDCDWRHRNRPHIDEWPSLHDLYGDAIRDIKAVIRGEISPEEFQRMLENHDP